MISTVQQTQQMLLKKGSLEKDLIFKKQYMMTSPGCKKICLDKLKDLIPIVSESYCNVLDIYSINRVEIDGFAISPSSFDSIDVVESLVDTYQDPFFPKEFMDKHRMYQVGSYNTDLICVTAGTDQYQEGEVLYVDEGYDIYNPEDNQIWRLAKDFEQFLIIAGPGSAKKLDVIDNLTKKYGGYTVDWVKKSSSAYKASDGVKIETHWYENLKTGQRFEPKTKL